MSLNWDGQTTGFPRGLHRPNGERYLSNNIFLLSLKLPAVMR